MSLYISSEMIVSHTKDVASTNDLISLPLLACLPYEIWQLIVFNLAPQDISELSILCREMATLIISTSLVATYYEGVFVPQSRPSGRGCQRKECEAVTTTFCVHDAYTLVRSRRTMVYSELGYALRRHVPIARISPCELSLRWGRKGGKYLYRDKLNGLSWKVFNLPIIGSINLIGEHFNGKEKSPWVALRRHRENDCSSVFAIVNLCGGPSGLWYYQRGGLEHGTGWMSGVFQQDQTGRVIVNKESVKDVTEQEVADYCSTVNIVL